MAVYATLFGTGSLLYGRIPQAIVWFAILLVSGVWLIRIVRSLWTGSTDRTD
jgi:hypothetical protein